MFGPTTTAANTPPDQDIARNPRSAQATSTAQPLTVTPYHLVLRKTGLEALLGVCPLSQLTQGVGGSSCSLLSGGVAVLCCCIGPPPSRCSTRRGARYGLADLPAFQAGHIPSWHKSCECYALWLVAADSGWLLLLLSTLLSVAGPGPHLRGLPGPVTAPCPAQAPPPNPIAADPDGRRVLSGGGGADHEVTPEAPLTGPGCCGHSYGGFGGGHPPFQPHVWFPVPSQPTPDSCDTRNSRRGTSASMSPVDGKLSP